MHIRAALKHLNMYIVAIGWCSATMGSPTQDFPEMIAASIIAVVIFDEIFIPQCNSSPGDKWHDNATGKYEYARAKH